MFLVIEIDKQYAGFGIDWHEKVRGIRLGFVAVHLIKCPFHQFARRLNSKGALYD